MPSPEYWFFWDAYRHTLLYVRSVSSPKDIDSFDNSACNRYVTKFKYLEYLNLMTENYYYDSH